MNKKFIPVAAVVALILVVGGVFAATQLLGKKDEPQEQVQQKKKITLPVNVISLEEKPIVSVEPQADGHNVVIGVDKVRKDAKTAEYELEYQAGTLLQAATNVFNLDQLPTSEKILLGSCSAGGACTYHEDVKGGTLLMTFEGGSDPYALKSDWKYIDNKTKETEVSSRDGKFQLSSKDIASNRYLIIFNAYGIPDGVPGTVVSSPYSLSSSSALKGTAQLTMRANEDGGTTIVGWDGSKWQEFDSTANGKELTAQVDLLPLYVAIKK